MIFGPSIVERRKRRETWTRRFAWVPVELFDGRMIWLEHYYARVSKADPFDGPGVRPFEVTQRFREIPTPVDQSWRENPPAQE